ncbi:MAG: pilus assembly protein TadG-related protein [Deltaproteobacteria bacterium]
MNSRKRLGDENGSCIAIFTIVLVTMLGFSALVVDIGNVALHKAKTQAIVDAIALAAAQDLPDTSKALETAQQYAELNGIPPSEIQVTFTNSNNSIRVKAAEHVDYFFAKVFNLQGTNVEARSGAAKSLEGNAFGYTLFSGSSTSTLILNGASMDITGSTHSNSNFIVNGSDLTITGAAEACGSITTNGNWISIGQRLPNSKFIDMPNFSELIKTQAQQAGTAYNGNKTYNGSNIDVDSGMYVNGSVTINGSRFSGEGCILAERDVIFNGSNLNQTSEDAVCIYSKTGNIIINGCGAEFEGIVYAPNGYVIFNGSNQTVRGRVVAKSITINGSNLSVIGGITETNSLPFYGTKLEI